MSEETKKALEAAEARLAQARADVDEARRVHDNERLEATGLNGHLVSYEATRGFRGEKVTKRFVVEKVRWGNMVAGRSIKADGSIGAREDYHYADRVTDLGMYEAKP